MIYFTDTNTKIGNQNILVDSDLKILGIHFEHKLNFNLDIDKILKCGSGQLNASIALIKLWCSSC